MVPVEHATLMFGRLGWSTTPGRPDPFATVLIHVLVTPGRGGHTDLKVCKSLNKPSCAETHIGVARDAQTLTVTMHDFHTCLTTRTSNSGPRLACNYPLWVLGISCFTDSPRASTRLYRVRCFAGPIRSRFMSASIGYPSR